MRGACMEVQQCKECLVESRDWYTRAGIVWCRSCWEDLVRRESKSCDAAPLEQRYRERHPGWRANKQEYMRQRWKRLHGGA